MIKLTRWVASAAMVALAGTAQAGLTSLGGGKVYDDVLNITWLADWNYAKTSGFDADGAMDQATARAWASNLVFGGTTGWRLPTALNADGSGPCGQPQPIINPAYNCTGSEMGHLFYADLGGHAGESVLNSTGDTAQELANRALFSNVQASQYWSETDLAAFPSIDAWFFDFSIGGQAAEIKSLEFFALAVHDGMVPEPRTLALVLAALGITAALRRPRPLRATTAKP